MLLPYPFKGLYLRSHIEIFLCHLPRFARIAGQEFIWEDIDLECFKKFGVEPLDICPTCQHKTHLCYRMKECFIAENAMSQARI